MAVINIERLNQLKKEKEIELGIIDDQFNIWVNNISERLSDIGDHLKDLNDTYRFCEQSKLNLDVFNIEGFDIRFKEWSEYHNYSDFIECIISKTQYSRFYIKDYELIIVDSNSKIPFRGCWLSNFKNKDDLRLAVETSLLKLQQYCSIMNERLNNL